MKKILASVVGTLFAGKSANIARGWATDVDILNTGLTRNVANSVGGCVLGEVGMKGGDRPLIDLSLSPVLAVGPARVGKTSAIAIPSLLRWSGSAVVLDINAERWRATRDWREKLGADGVLRSVLRMDLSNGNDGGAAFNVLSEIRDYAGDVEQEACFLAEQLLVRGDYFWVGRARSFLVVILLHAIHTFSREMCSMSSVAAFVGAHDFGAICDALCDVVHPHAKRVRVVVEALKEQGSEKAGEAIRSMILNELSVFMNPAVRAATDSSNFSIDSLIDGASPRSLFLTWGVEDTLAVRTVSKLMLSFIYRRCEYLKTRAHKLLVVLDDYPALDLPVDFSDKIALSPYLGVKLLVSAQSLSELASGMGEEQLATFLKLFHNRIFFRPGSLAEAESISAHARQCAGNIVDRATNGVQSALEITPSWLLGEKLPSQYGAGCSVMVIAGTTVIAASPKFYWQDPVYQIRAKGISKAA